MNPRIKISFKLDGLPFSVETASDRRLLDILREDAGITGVKEGCGEGECGACSIFFNGKLANSCCLPAIAAEGAVIETIKGFSAGREFRVISQAYADAGAVQCGFCTPGFIMATAALLRENPTPDNEEIRLGLSGNLCRCTGYTMIIDAVRLASERMASDD